MTSFKKHIRVNCSFTGCSRNFQFNVYGDYHLALKAALSYDKRATAILVDFDSYKRKPAERQGLLDQHGAKGFTKKSIGIQRVALQRSLDNGDSSSVEAGIITDMCKDTLDQSLLDKSSIQYSDSSFKAIFQGQQQKLEQCFKSFKDASSWIQQMDKADKDPLGCNCLFTRVDDLTITDKHCVYSHYCWMCQLSWQPGYADRI